MQVILLKVETQKKEGSVRLVTGWASTAKNDRAKMMRVIARWLEK